MAPPMVSKEPSAIPVTLIIKGIDMVPAPIVTAIVLRVLAEMLPGLRKVSAIAS